MKEFKVLVEKQYVIGHYARVMAEDADDARNKVIGSIEGDESDDFLDHVEDSFSAMEEEVDDTLESLGGFILNSYGIDGVLRVSEQEGWGRPLVMEVEEEVAGAGDGKDGN